MNTAFHASFVKRFRKLPPNVRNAFRLRLALFLSTPFHVLLRNHSVGRVYPGCRSFNVTGDYRAIYRVEGDTAIFILIGTHADLY